MWTLCCFTLLVLAPPAQVSTLTVGQGLPRDPASVLGADSSYKTLRQYLRGPQHGDKRIA